ncbi:MAG: trigger factor [Bacteroidia bacterium]|nr:trigger factor [Bacteroidia bacterium]
MNISKEQVSPLNAIVTIELQPEDYQPRVNEVIRKYQHTASIPGFRPGKVPAGLIRKMYGKSLLLEELNKLLSESLGKYISENNLNVLGSPLPKTGEQTPEFQDGNKFEFSYELGIAPDFDLMLPSEKIPYFRVQVDNKMVDDDVSDIRRRYGKFTNPEVSEENHILYGEFNQLDADGQFLEGGHKTITTISLEMIPDVQKRKKFTGLKKEEFIDFNPMDFFENETEVSSMLKLEKTSPALSSGYRFTIMSINQIEMAELNQELFDRIYEPGVVQSEEEMREKVRERIASYFERQSQRKLKKDLRNLFLEINQIPLPDDFLKRMLQANVAKEDHGDHHDFEHDYFHASEDLRWNLIQEKLTTKYNITVTGEEIKALAENVMREQFIQYGYYEVSDDKIQEMAGRYMGEESNYEKLFRSIRESKVFDSLMTDISLDNSELPYQEFVAKLEEKTSHELEHHS